MPEELTPDPDARAAADRLERLRRAADETPIPDAFPDTFPRHPLTTPTKDA